LLSNSAMASVLVWLAAAACSALLSGCGSNAGLDTTTTTPPPGHCTVAAAYPPDPFHVGEQRCRDAGKEDTLPYRQGLRLADGLRYLPYFSSHSLTSEQPEVTEAMLWIHGAFGDANRIFCEASAAATKSGAGSSTMIVAPWFGNFQMQASVWAPNASLDDSLSTCWHKDGWLDGDDASDDGDSSYALLDKMVEELKNNEKLPNLKRITVAGFSAGCQMASRWAVFSNIAQDTRVIVGDCGSYLYLDHERPAEHCRKEEDTGVDHKCDSFLKPDSTQCAKYNHYKEGLDLKHVKSNSYLSAFANDASKVAKVVDDFAKKDFRLLLGAEAVCNCNAPNMVNSPSCFVSNSQCGPSLFAGCCDTWPDSSWNELDFNCQAMLQGSNRLQRGLNYADHLERFFSRRGVPYKSQVALFHGMHDTRAWVERVFSAWSDDASEVALV